MINFCYATFYFSIACSPIYLLYNIYLYRSQRLPLRVSQYYNFTQEEKKAWLRLNLKVAIIWFLISSAYSIFHVFIMRNRNTIMDVITVVCCILLFLVYGYRYYKQIYAISDRKI